jgi:hypothetical protein
MPDYYEFMLRHSEFGVQDLIERLERYSGIKSDILLPLEQRWFAVMQMPQATDQQASLASV